MAVNSSNSNRRNKSRRTRSTTKKDTDNQPQNQVTKAESTATESVEAETKMADNVPKSDTLKEKLDVATKPTPTEGNSAPTQIQVSPSQQPTAMIHNRPLEQNQFEIAGMLTAKRPIGKAVHAPAVTFIQSENTGNSMANRPVSTTEIQISSMVMNRPIASNEIDDPNLLMGYLD